MKNLEISLYENGYRTEHINCINTPVAVGAGYFDYDYYFLYSFIDAINRNWNYELYKKTDWYSLCKEFLNLIGLDFIKHSILSKESFLETIRNEITNERPTIFIATYSSIPWCSNYLEDDTEHGYLITGFHTKKPVFLLRDDFILKFSDNENVEKHLYPIFKGHPSWKYQITGDTLFDIWNNSNKIHLEKQRIFNNSIYSIGKSEDFEKVSPTKILQYLIYIINFNHNCLEDIMKTQQNYINLDEKDLNDAFDIFRRDLVSSLRVISEVSKMLIKELADDTSYPAYSEKIDKLISDHTNIRQLFCLKFHKYTYAKKNIAEKYAEEVLHKESKFTEEFSVLIKGLLEADNEVISNVFK